MNHTDTKILFGKNKHIIIPTAKGYAPYLNWFSEVLPSEYYDELSKLCEKHTTNNVINLEKATSELYNYIASKFDNPDDANKLFIFREILNSNKTVNDTKLKANLIKYSKMIIFTHRKGSYSIPYLNNPFKFINDMIKTNDKIFEYVIDVDKLISDYDTIKRNTSLTARQFIRIIGICDAMNDLNKLQKPNEIYDDIKDDIQYLLLNLHTENKFLVNYLKYKPSKILIPRPVFGIYHSNYEGGMGTNKNDEYYYNGDITSSSSNK